MALCLPRLDLALQVSGATAGVTVLLITPGIMAVCLIRNLSGKIQGYSFIALGLVGMLVSLVCLFVRETGWNVEVEIFTITVNKL